MSQTRLEYDCCSYKKRMQESSGPGTYAMFADKYASPNPCRIQLGVVGGNNVSVFRGNLVDLESDLRGQTRMASLCPVNKYTPTCSAGAEDGDGLPCATGSASLSHLPTCQLSSYHSVQLPDGSIHAPSCMYTVNGELEQRK